MTRDNYSREMAEGLRGQHADLLSSSMFVSDSLTMFESMRRRLFEHLGWEYPIITPGLPATRGSTMFWCTLVSECRECNGQHPYLPKSSYLVWHGYLPVQCNHGQVISAIYVEPEGKPEGEEEYPMPDQVTIVEPPGASVTSGGELTLAKLEKDRERVKERSKEALRHLRAAAYQSEQHPPPSYFPELEAELLKKKISQVEKRADDMDDDLVIRIEARRRADNDFEVQRPGKGAANGAQEEEDVEVQVGGKEVDDAVVDDVEVEVHIICNKT